MTVQLSLRRTYNDHPRPEDNDKFWSVIHEGVRVGRINQQRGPSDEPPYWMWVIHMHSGRYMNGVQQEMAIDGREETREDAMLAFRKAFERFLAYVGEEGWLAHVEHMARIERTARNATY